MWQLGNRFFLERRDNMEKYEGPILEYDDGEGGGDLIQPMCCNTICKCWSYSLRLIVNQIIMKHINT